jgi:hypothetical protein
MMKKLGPLLLLLGLLPAGALSARSVPAPPALAPAQRLTPEPQGPVETLESDHFSLRLRPGVLTTEMVEQARETAEKAWSHCAERFQGSPRGKITLDLTPRFAGATGFARPGDPDSRDPEKRPLIGIRFAELSYLGLSPDYVVTHEVAHVFSGPLAGTTLGEGIADWAAGTFSGLPMRPWWGRALRDAGLWIDPEPFFITGEFDAAAEVGPVIRTAQYVESGLLVRFLVERFGWQKFRRFAADYGAARGRLESNEERKQRPPPRGPRRGPDPRLAPDTAVILATFERHFGEGWPTLRVEWEREMAAEVAVPADVRRLVLGQQIYGAVRNYEMWALERKPSVPGPMDQVVRAAFSEANRLLQSGEYEQAERALARARGMVEQLRRPSSIAAAGPPRETG